MAAIRNVQGPCLGTNSGGGRDQTTTAIGYSGGGQIQMATQDAQAVSMLGNLKNYYV